MELVDEAHLHAAHARAVGITHAGAVVPVDDDVAAVRRLEQAGDVQQRGLAGARRPDEGHRLPGIDVGRGAVQHGDLARSLMEGAHQPVEPQHGVRRGVSHGLELLGQGFHAVAHS